jgi:hypothetical protein
MSVYKYNPANNLKLEPKAVSACVFSRFLTSRYGSADVRERFLNSIVENAVIQRVPNPAR